MRKDNDIATKMARIDEMENNMRYLQEQNQRKDEEMGVFMNMFKAG